MRQIEIELDGVVGKAEIVEHGAAETAAAVWERLPLTATLSPCKWSGSACWIKTAPLPQATSDLRTSAIEPGSLVAAADGEILLGYGPAEFRDDRGVQQAIRFASVRAEDQAALLAKMTQMHDEGSKTISLRRA
jgi:hypothetical protein